MTDAISNGVFNELSCEEIVSVLSKEFPGWDVPKYPNDGKQFNWSFV